MNVVRDTILMRHLGQSITFQGQTVLVTKESATRYFGLPNLAKLTKLFVELADNTYDDPPALPFPDAGVPSDKSCVFFNVDECQVRCLNDMIAICNCN